MDSNQQWSRRKFIESLSLAGATIMLGPFSAYAYYDLDPRTEATAAKAFGIDSHNHIDVPFLKENFNVQQYDLTKEFKNSGLSAICMTFQVDRPALSKPGDAYERFIISLDEMDLLLKEQKIQRALNFSDVKKARNQGRPIVIQSVEGAHFLEGNLDRLTEAYRRGIRHLGLLHDNQTSPPIGDIYTDPAKFGGLTTFGKSIIKEANNLGMLIDLAHCSNKAIEDAISASNRPIIVSHTGLNTQLGTNDRMARMMMPRLISKEYAKVVANAGGVIGVWTHLADTSLAYAQNIRAMVDVAGIDHVCIGTDTTLANSSDGSRQDNSTNSIWKAEEKGFFFSVVDSMLKSGFTEKEIVKIGSSNYCRLFDQATSR
jgi:membrane dipeptidase